MPCDGKKTSGFISAVKQIGNVKKKILTKKGGKKDQIYVAY
jgi:hypothetical protein